MSARNAREELAHWLAEQDRWTSTQDKDRARLAELSKGAAARVLDDPSTAETIAVESGRLTAHADLAGKAANEAGERAHAAKLRIVAEEADRIDGEAEPIRARLADHDAKTARLLKALQAHTESEWREWTTDKQIEEARSLTPGGLVIGMTFQGTKAEATRAQVAKLEKQAGICRAVAAEQSIDHLIGFGENPTDVLPDVVNPSRGGVVVPIGFEYLTA